MMEAKVNHTGKPNPRTCDWIGMKGALGSRPAFTLVELLVVIAIIGILVALLLPAVQAAREAARKSQCQNHFRQVGIALHNYLSAATTFPPGMIHWDPRFGNTSSGPCAPAPNGEHRGFSWSTYILPYLEHQAIHDQLNFDKFTGYADRDPNGVAQPSNYQVSGKPIEAYICPSDNQALELVRCCTGPTNGTHPDEDMGRTNMAGVGDAFEWQCTTAGAKHFNDANGVMANVDGAQPRRVPDGLSKTLIITEVLGAGYGTHLGHFWSNWNIIDTRDGINGPFTIVGGQWDDSNRNGIRNTGAASWHTGGAHFVMGDGSVQFLDENIGPDVLEQLTTRANQQANATPGRP